MSDFTRRRFLTGASAVAAAVVVGVAVAPLALGTTRPKPITIPFGPWLPDMPDFKWPTGSAEFIPLVPKEPWIGPGSAFKGRRALTINRLPTYIRRVVNDARLR